jgi:hypothetical protein
MAISLPAWKAGCFLGDYGDGGRNTLKVLELLMTFKMKNQERVDFDSQKLRRSRHKRG